MKKVLILMALLVLAVTPLAFAEDVIAGAKMDMPNLVRFTDKITLGVEGGKDILSNPFDGETRSYFEDDKGYFGYIKITYTGTLLNFVKK